MDKERMTKIAKLRFLVIAVTVLVLAAWALNLKHELRLANETIDKNAAEEAAALRIEINKTIDQMGKKIDDLKDEVDSAVPVSSSSTNGLPEKTANCPEYVNCMPMVGETPVCSVPPGCEEETLVVY